MKQSFGSHHTTCAAPGCTAQLTLARYFMCWKHFFKLPEALRNTLWDSFQPGQERGKVKPSAEWIRARDEAVELVK